MPRILLEVEYTEKFRRQGFITVDVKEELAADGAKLHEWVEHNVAVEDLRDVTTRTRSADIDGIIPFPLPDLEEK